MRKRLNVIVALMASALASNAIAAEVPDLAGQPANQWIKRTPLPDAPVSPRLGYEGACVWDNKHQVLIRYGGHNQGGGGEQGAELWTYNPKSSEWKLHEPNTSPPGVCCNAQNVFDTQRGRYIRFPLFSGNHGWQWSRELYLNDSSLWTYDLDSNRWRNMRPLPAPKLAGLRCASWDTDEKVVVVFGGEGSSEGTLIYDPARNEWRWPKPALQPEFRSGGNMAYDAANRRHVLFGSQFTSDPHTWTYDVRANEWKDMKPDLQPPTDKNDAVLTYDPFHRVVLAIVKVTTGSDESSKHELQTWSYDAAANRWQKMNPKTEPEPSGNRARNLIFAPELNLAILENCPSKPREQQIWTYRFAESSSGSWPATKPAVVTSPLDEVVVSVLSATKVEISWRPATRDGQSSVEYHVERAIVQAYSDDQLHLLKKRTSPLPELSVGALRRIGPFQRLTTTPIRDTKYVDSTIDLDRPEPIDGDLTYERNLAAEYVDDQGREYRKGVYAYRVRSVGTDGTVGGPSPAAFTIPSSPQHVFSREEGATCQLKWAPNPEQGIAGYRVYRMDGRYDKDPVSRLTPDPINATQFADPSAGTTSRRYYIVAVNAMGQEGFPSSPVWFQREWRDYYKPFIGEWHQ